MSKAKQINPSYIGKYRRAIDGIFKNENNGTIHGAVDGEWDCKTLCGLDIWEPSEGEVEDITCKACLRILGA